MTRASLVLVGMALVATGCPSAYERTYEQRTAQLGREQERIDAQEAAAYEQARKYAAVVYFQTGSDVVGDDGRRELGWFVRQMAPYPKAIILIQGYADATGSEATNAGLSERRAASVADVLEGQGIARERLMTHGFGEAHPAAANASAAGRRDNRRVEVTVR